MQIKISTRHGQINGATQEFIQKKAEKLLHLFPRLIMIEVTVDMKSEQREVELLVEAEHKHNFVAREKNQDVLTAVETVVAKLEAQIRKYKEKIQNHRGAPSASEVARTPTLEESTEE